MCLVYRLTLLQGSLHWCIGLRYACKVYRCIGGPNTTLDWASGARIHGYSVHAVKGMCFPRWAMGHIAPPEFRNTTTISKISTGPVMRCLCD